MRSSRRHLATAILATLLGACFATPAVAQQTSITYQGLIQTDGFPASGQVDLRFRMYDLDSNGTQLGPEITLLNVPLTAGTFTVPLDFGVDPYVAGSRRYLELDARRTGEGTYATLSPRQPLTAAPYSLGTRGLFVDTQGNVGIQTITPAFPLDVRGGFRASGGVVNDASNLVGTDPRATNPGWQSFVAEHNGNLKSVTFRAFAPSAWTGTLQIFAGQGTGGAALTGPIAISGPGSPALQTITASIPDGTALIVGQTYSFATTATNPFTPVIATGNPYPGGQSSTGINIDLYFITQIAPTGLIVNSDGRVGIGTLAPTAELDVRGNIRLGGTGQYSAVAAEEQLRTIRGNVSGAPSSGTGWAVQQILPGRFTVTFTTPFATGVVPTLVLTPTSAVFPVITSTTNFSFDVHFVSAGGLDTFSGFNFIVTGPR